MKKESGHIDATPSKRLFLSIIADYDLNRSICELIDNALDVWVRMGRKGSVAIDIELNKDQQLIRVIDNAGGIKKEELGYIVGPGQTGTQPTDETIGIFGVGTKRAVVALSQDIRITTRFAKEKTYRVEFDEDWLGTEEWELPYYEVDGIAERTTIIELQRLRMKLIDETVEHLKEHLGTTYARFLKRDDISIRLNKVPVKPVTFTNWAYPPKYEPRKYTGTLKTEDGRQVKVKAVAGLTRESSPGGGEYGVYFYCNDRLIARALKTYDVGFVKGLAGQPHPKISLTRVLVSLRGDARSMPWNSSKSGINPNHEVFVAIRSWLIQVVKDYASLSRALEGDWPEQVFRYTAGDIVDVSIDSFPEVKKSFLPPLPKSKLRYADIVAHANRGVAKEKPWTRGLYESIIAADLISRQHLDQKNRIVLILLDSTLEIAFKEYLVNESGHTYGDRQLLDIFGARNKVQSEMKKYVSIDDSLWRKVDHYYRMRCKLVHERTTIAISDTDIEDYRSVVQQMLKKFYKLKFSDQP